MRVWLPSASILSALCVFGLVCSPAPADEQWPKAPARRIVAASAPKEAHGVPQVRCIAFAPDGKTLAYSSQDVCVYDIDAANVVKRLPRQAWWPHSMAFRQAGKNLVFIDRDKAVFAWNWRTDPEPTLLHEQTKASLLALAVHEESGAIAVADAANSQVYLWRAAGEKMTFLSDRPYPLGFVHEGKALLVGANADAKPKPNRRGVGLPTVFGLAGKKIACIEDEEYANALDADVLIPSYAVPSADGRSLLLHSDKKVRFWNLADGKLLREWSFGADFPTERDFLQNVRMALSPDGARVAVASDERAIRLYSARDGKLLTRLRADQGSHIFSLAFSPDGRTLVSGGEDGTLLLWRLP